VFGYLTLIRIAKQVGFTLADTRELARACSAGSPPTARADAIARRKLVELEARIREAQQMRRFLMQLLRLTTRSRKDGPR
jgi:DNA-binding transcriptional MerR regulator